MRLIGRELRRRHAGVTCGWPSTTRLGPADRRRVAERTNHFGEDKRRRVARLRREALGQQVDGLLGLGARAC